ncbi:MAG: hypothetical protein ABJK28_08700 [Algibacter sp.]
MAITIEGKSVCKICKKTMYIKEGLIGFPNFTSNIEDELSFFTDTGFHKECFKYHPLRASVISRLKDLEIIKDECELYIPIDKDNKGEYKL